MKKIISFALAMTMLLTLFAGCAKVPATDPTKDPAKDPGGDTAKVRETIIVADRREAKTLNPHASNDAGTAGVTALLYDPLLTFDKEMKIIANLATEWTKIDDTHYNFKLRDDVFFHNGDKFTAQDVLDTFALASASPATASTLGVIDVENSVKVSDTEVTIALKTPYAPFLNTIALPIAGIVNKKAIEAGGDKYNDNPAGTGPFQMKTWKKGDALELATFDQYWGDKPAFKNLIIRLIPEAATRLIEVETGGVDIALGIVDSDAKNLKDSTKVNLISTNILNVNYLSFNCSKAPFDNQKVRQAVTHAIDVETIVKNAYFGLAEQSFAPLSPDVFGYHNAGVKYPYDVEKAKAALTEAGYPNGFKTSLTINGDAMVGEMMQNMLGQIGIQVELKQLDFANWLDALVNGKQEMYLGGWTVPSADAAEGLEAFHSANHGGGGNRSFYTNTELDSKLDAAARELDQTKRLEMYKEIQEIIADEAVYVNLKVGQTHVATKPDIEDIYFMPTQEARLWKIAFKK